MGRRLSQNRESNFPIIVQVKRQIRIARNKNKPTDWSLEVGELVLAITIVKEKYIVLSRCGIVRLLFSSRNHFFNSFDPIA